MARYKFTEGANRCTLYDTETGIQISFPPHRYNEEQEVSCTEDMTGYTAPELAYIMNDAADYMRRHHIGVATDAVYGFEFSEDDSRLFLCHFKEPIWKIELLVGESVDDLAETLIKAAKWLKQNNNSEQ